MCIIYVVAYEYTQHRPIYTGRYAYVYHMYMPMYIICISYVSGSHCLHMKPYITCDIYVVVKLGGSSGADGIGGWGWWWS